MPAVGGAIGNWPRNQLNPPLKSAVGFLFSKFARGSAILMQTDLNRLSDPARSGAEPDARLNLLIAVYQSAGLLPKAARAAAWADWLSLTETKPLTDSNGGNVPRPKRWLVIGAFLAIYLIWGSTYLAIRIGVAAIPPFLMAGTRFFVAGALLYGFELIRGARKPTGRQWRDAAVSGGLMLTIGNGGVTWAELTVPSAVAALVAALIPVWMVLLQWALPGGKRPHGATIAGLVIGFFGVGILAELGTGLRGEMNPWGIPALICASLGWAAGSLFNRQSDRPAAPLVGVAMQMLTGGLLLLFVAAVRGEFRGDAMAASTGPALAAWSYLMVAGSLVGYSAYVWLLRVSTPARVATYAYVNPVIALLLGCTLGHEPFSSKLLVATALILAAVILIVKSGPSGKRAARPT